MDAEALRLIKLLEAWSPGYSNGKKVMVMCTETIEFKLKGRYRRKR
jgi:hypothetical protein